MACWLTGFGPNLLCRIRAGAQLWGQEYVPDPENAEQRHLQAKVVKGGLCCLDRPANYHFCFLGLHPFELVIKHRKNNGSAAIVEDSCLFLRPASEGVHIQQLPDEE